MGVFDDLLRQIPPGPERLQPLKALWREHRDRVVALHGAGAPGRKVMHRLTRLTDSLVGALYQDATSRHMDSTRSSPGLALVAVGGYGRGELNPHSDLDLLFLYQPGQEEAAKAVSNDVLYPLWDLRCSVGHSVRTVADCLEVGKEDLSAQTCMMESRLLVGDKQLFDQYSRDFTDRVVKKGGMSYLYRKAEEQRQRHQRYGASVFLQQPNIKESPGGLRDIHYLIWIAIAGHGTGNLKQLEQNGVIDGQDYAALIKAQGFFWRVRNDLHFHLGKGIDVLTFEEQLRISEVQGFVDSRTSRAVERFMRHYFFHASRVLDICSRFVDRATDPPLTRALSSRIFSRKVAPYFVLSNYEITVKPRKIKGFLQDGAGVVNFFHLAQAYGLRTDPEVVEVLSHTRIPIRQLRTAAANQAFRSILSWESGVAVTLERLHRLRILGRIMPEFARVDRLVTFSQYHQYTVDAHSLHALELVEALRGADDVFGKTYREIRRKEVLHLAILLHDSGKGQHRDHCEAGAELARAAATRLGYGEEEIELLVFLVEAHLEMTHIAFRRDISAPEVLSAFARRMQTPERLKMLFVLTHVDIRAVGPGTWNNWKKDLLVELYMRAIKVLAGRRLVLDMVKTTADVRGKVRALLAEQGNLAWEQMLEKAPGRYLVCHPPEEIVGHLEMILQLADRPARVSIQVQERGEAVITVCAHSELVKGLFSRVAGVLTAKDLVVHNARISTFRDDVVLDEFWVNDPTMDRFTDHDRWERLRQTLLATLEGRIEVESLFVGGHGRFSHDDIQFSNTEPMVQLDNNVSDSFTVIDVFAADRQGLLYAITRSLLAQHLDVFFSRIATKADQVVDVFYVKDEHGEKITDPEHQEVIRNRLLEVVKQNESAERV